MITDVLVWLRLNPDALVALALVLVMAGLFVATGPARSRQVAALRRGL